MGDEISVFDGRTGEWRKPTKEERERILAERAGAPAAEPADGADGEDPATDQEAAAKLMARVLIDKFTTASHVA